IALLNSLTTDHQGWRKRILHQRGAIALQQFNLANAERFYTEAIALQPPQQNERMQLAHVYLLQCRLDDAYTQLEKATQALAKKCPPGPVRLPIRDFIGTLINQFRINPMRLAQIQKSQLQKSQLQERQIQENRPEQERDGATTLQQGHCLPTLASIIAEEPTYLGAAIILAKELYTQGIWADLKTALQTALSIQQPCGAAIPKRIIQFWDDPEPPPDVQKLGQTWLEHNPDYEYKRFSLREAIAFLQQHYPPDILNAFYLCDHPAAQADFFRLAYLNCYGGFYADADDRCRRSLEPLRQSMAELVLYQEEYASLGNNFLGSVPHQPMIRSALYQATTNLCSYSTEGAWMQTGPGLLTSVVCSGLLPYLPQDDYRLWPRLLVLSRGELSNYVWRHISLAYKRTEKSWQNQVYPKMRFDRSTVLNG
ncbi:MAG: hypothetical protein F6K30_26835, partial [Cyanothece sp. SIO2G6]|nr:hypothetical protein [Cyanothece sp. SIO2G6]